MHTRHHLILVYQSSYFAPVKPPATATAACVPLKNSLFILSGDTEFALRSIVFSLPHAPLIIPLMDHNSHCVCVCVCVCMRVRVCVCEWVSVCVGWCVNCLCEDTFRAPWEDFISWFYPLVACPTSCSSISFPDPQTPVALMWHHRVVYLARTPSWNEYRGILAVCWWFCTIYLGIVDWGCGTEGGLTEGDTRFKQAMHYGFETQTEIDSDISTYFTGTSH